MKTVWKYVIDPAQPVANMPEGAKILCAAAQGENVCVWAEVDPALTTLENRWFDVYGTGHKINDVGLRPRKYLGTAFLQGGSLVFHVFERVAWDKSMELT